MADNDDALVERVALAICEDAGMVHQCAIACALCKVDARAAIAAARPVIRAAALEEAANRVWQMRRDGLTAHGDNHGKAGEWMRAALDDAEVAIRAMIDEEKTNDL